MSALRLPPRSQLRDLAWYKGGQLALTLQTDSQPTPYSGLHLVATNYLVFAPVQQAEGATALQVTQVLSTACTMLAAAFQEQTRSRAVFVVEVQYLTVTALKAPSLLSASGGKHLAQVCLDQHAVIALESVQSRQRMLPYPTVLPPMAVSGPRGVACVFAGVQRALLLDLEDDEAAEDEEDTDEEEDMQS